MRTAQITIQRMGKRKRSWRWPLNGTGTAVVVMMAGGALVWLAMLGH